MPEFYLDPTVYSGRPANTANRLPVEAASYDLLDRLGVPFTRLDHDPTPSIEACEEVEARLGIEICKNLFLCNRQKTQFYLLMMPGRKPFRTKELSAQIGSARLSFADEAFMQEFLHITPGSVSVLGLMNDTEGRVQLLIDRDVTAQAFFGCHPCINTSSLKIATADLLDKILLAARHEPVFVSL
ncbi:MAG: prolyl-tRNA synthetase associated domain-containing protein [Intestinibacillus sp.]